MMGDWSDSVTRRGRRLICNSGTRGRWTSFWQHGTRRVRRGMAGHDQAIRSKNGTGGKGGRASQESGQLSRGREQREGGEDLQGEIAHPRSGETTVE